MKFKIRSKTLLGKLAAVGRVIQPKNPIFILGSFLFELKDGLLFVTGSSQESVVTAKIDVAEADGSGRFCVDAKRLLSLLKATPDNLVSVYVDDDSLEVTINYINGKYSLAAQKADAYPEPPEIQEEDILAKFTLPSAQIINCLGKVSFAVGADDFHPQMMGVLWDVKEDCIVFVATDTRLLSKYRCTQTSPGKACRFILPGAVVPLVGEIARRESAMTVTVTGKHAVFTGESHSVRTLLIKGNYPDYDRVIPKNNGNILTIDRVAALNAVERISLCSDDHSNAVRMEISPSRVVVSAQDAKSGMEGTESVPCRYEGRSDIVIGFSGSYFLKILGAMDTQEIRVKLADGSLPAVIIPSEDDEFGELTLLCMPIAVRDS